MLQPIQPVDRWRAYKVQLLENIYMTEARRAEQSSEGKNVDAYMLNLAPNRDASQTRDA